MAKELVFGHTNPDTDAIGAAYAYSAYENLKGGDTEPVALGEPNDETKFAFETFGFDKPRVVTTVADLTDKVMLVDHNEFQQSAPDIKDVTITHVVDHHRISNFMTADPLYYRAEPIGSTSTVIWKMFKEAEMMIPKNIAGLMMSGIISDTLLLKSPTTTKWDEEALADLAEIAGINYQEYGINLLKAGTDTSSKSEKELIDLDAKTFEMNGKKVRVAQMNTVDIPEVLERKAGFIKEITAENAAEGYDLFVFLITNILDSDSEGLVIGSADGVAKFEKTFAKKVVADQVALPGVVSRKKQIVPQLSAEY